MSNQKTIRVLQILIIISALVSGASYFNVSIVPESIQRDVFLISLILFGLSVLFLITNLFDRKVSYSKNGPERSFSGAAGLIGFLLLGLVAMFLWQILPVFIFGL